jgi:hypothetical protein
MIFARSDPENGLILTLHDTIRTNLLYCGFGFQSIGILDKFYQALSSFSKDYMHR